MYCSNTARGAGFVVRRYFSFWLLLLLLLLLVVVVCEEADVLTGNAGNLNRC